MHRALQPSAGPAASLGGGVRGLCLAPNPPAPHPTLQLAEAAAAQERTRSARQAATSSSELRRLQSALASAQAAAQQEEAAAKAVQEEAARLRLRTSEARRTR